MSCMNCGQEAAGNFCSHCGQSTKIARVTVSNFLSDLSDSVFQINRGLFFSLKELFVRPRHSIREYLSGKRKNHIKPIAYALTLSTIYFLISQILDTQTFFDDVLTGWTNRTDETETGRKQLAIMTWFAKNYTYTMLLLLPLYSLSSYLLFFKSGFNYMEHFILNAYITGQQAIFYSLAATLSLGIKNGDVISNVALIISISYTLYVYWQFFSDKNKFGLILRVLSIYIVNLILLSLLFVVVFLAIG